MSGLLTLAIPGEVVATLILVILAIVGSFFMLIATRLKKCPSDKIMVIYGKVSGVKGSAKCIHGGVKFIWPFIQSYAFLDLTPISLSVDLRQALSRQNIRIDVPSKFTVGISTEEGVMQNAAERLLGLSLDSIQELAKDIILGQMRLIIATMDIEEINADRDKFLDAVSRNVETELKKIGLKLINVNVTDINDESGYIEALGKEAAAKAINDAKKSVAEKNRDGAVGEANAMMDQRIKVASSNSTAIQGENEAQVKISQSNATRRELEADALRRAVTAERIAEAKALQEAYLAQQEAELTRAAKERASLEADVIIKTEIEKQKKELEAEASAEMARRIAKGEADAIFSKMEAESRGIYEILSKQAEGFTRIMAAVGGNADDAVKMIISDKLTELTKIQVDAIKNIKIDKVTVWDSGTKDGASSTASFISSLLKSIPPMSELFKMTGMEMPKYLGTVKEEKENEAQTSESAENK